MTAYHEIASSSLVDDRYLYTNMCNQEPKHEVQNNVILLSGNVDNKHVVRFASPIRNSSGQQKTTMTPPLFSHSSYLCCTIA